MWALCAAVVSGAQGAQPASTPSPADTMAVYRAIAAHFSTLGDEPLDLPPLTGGPVHGCFVQVRLEGALVGVGSACTLDPAADRDAHRVVRDAVRKAIDDARAHTPLARDSLRDERIRELARVMTVSVELAGPLTPVDTESVERLDLRLSPGVDGLAVGLHERLVAMSPGVIMSRALTPSAAARALVAEATGSASMALDEVKALREAGVRLYALRTTHLAQSAPGREPVFLHRGTRVVPQTDLDSAAELRAFADLLAAGLMSRCAPGTPPTFTQGALRLTTGQFEQAIGDGSTPMLGALALRRYAELAREAPAPMQARAGQVAGALVHAATDGGASPGGGSAAALAVLARVRGDGAPGIDQPPWAGLVAALASENAPDAPASRALWALALAESPAQRAEAQVRVRGLLAGLSPESMPGAMPWLGLAQVRVADGAGDVPGAVTLREMRTLTWSRALTPAQAGEANADLVGGIVLDAGGPPLPTWQTARLALVTAVMLRDGRLTSAEERGREIVRVLSALRFLRQLTVDPDGLWLRPGLTAAVGSVRLAPWEQRTSAEATAITLLAVCEMVEALEGMRTDSP